MILTDKNKWIETYHSFHRDEIGIHGDDPEFDFKRKKEKIHYYTVFSVIAQVDNERKQKTKGKRSW